MKILVPTDFSEQAMGGALYAAHLAKELNAELILLHVIHVETPTMVHVIAATQVIENEITENVLEKGKSLENALLTKVPDIAISFKSIHGFPIEDMIQEFAIQNHIDLIVMGSKGASGIKKVIFGSNAVALINTSTIPTLLIPEFSQFRRWQTIIYATDIHHVDDEVRKIIPFAKHFDATIQILHILSPDSEEKMEALEIQNELVKQLKYSKLKFQIIYNKEIVEGIDNYVAEMNSDLLVLFTHRHTFFENVFGKSVTREIAFHNHIPLLVLKH